MTQHLAHAYEHRPAMHRGWRGAIVALAAGTYNLVALAVVDR